tara:strand:+ start:15473 stop:15643 length:171 start_codon:yes stop_codon:yes gene_type:complete
MFIRLNSQGKSLLINKNNIVKIESFQSGGFPKIYFVDGSNMEIQSSFEDLEKLMVK